MVRLGRSAVESVKIVVALRGNLFLAAPDRPFSRQLILGSLSPMVVFLTSIPLAFLSTTWALLWWLVGSLLAGWLLGRMNAVPPEDPV